MLKGLLKRVREDDAGFTLIELMVVVLIIGILVAIALPTFLGARNRANDKAAQSSVRNALAAAKTIFTDTDDYSTVTAATMTATEPSLQYATPSTTPTDVSLLVQNTTAGQVNGAIALVAYSKSGACFGLLDEADAGTTFEHATGQASCNAAGIKKVLPAAPYVAGW